MVTITKTRASLLNNIVAIILPILLILLHFTGNIVFLGLTIVLCIFFIKKLEVIIPVYWMASLSSVFFDLGEGVSASRYMSLLLCIAILLHDLRKGSLSFARLGVFLFVVVFTSGSSIFGASQSMSAGVPMLINLLTFYLIVNCRDINISATLPYISYASFLLIVYTSYQAYLGDAFLFTARYLEGEEGINANNMAMLVAQCGAIQIANFFVTQKPYAKAIAIMGVILSVMEIIALGSRSALVGFVAAIAISIYYSISRYNRGRLIIALFILLPLTFFVVNYFSAIDSPLLERFTMENVEESGGSGRVDNLKIIMRDIFPDYPLFGTGIGGTTTMEIQSQYHINNPAHNIVIDPLSQLGLVGFTLYIIFLFPYLKSIYKTTIEKKSIYFLILLAPLVGAIFNGIGEIVFFDKFFWNNVAFCFLLSRSIGQQTSTIVIEN